jgi:hypothetical protein
MLVFLSIVADDARSTRANANSPLLRLPPEIRNMIFEYAMTMRYNLELYYNRFSELSASGFSNYAHKRQRRFLSVRLPEVCRQIYSETATLFYRMNTFSFATEQAMRVWLKKRLPAQLEVIQRLDLLEWDDEKRVDICKDLKDTVCTNLSSLTQDELNADIIGETRWRRMEWIDERDYISTDDEDSWEQIRGDMGSDGDW